MKNGGVVQHTCDVANIIGDIMLLSCGISFNSGDMVMTMSDIILQLSDIMLKLLAVSLISCAVTTDSGDIIPDFRGVGYD